MLRAAGFDTTPSESRWGPQPPVMPASRLGGERRERGRGERETEGRKGGEERSGRVIMAQRKRCKGKHEKRGRRRGK